MICKESERLQAMAKIQLKFSIISKLWGEVELYELNNMTRREK